MLDKLRPYQQEAVEKIAQLGSAGLFFDTGIGKTATSLGLVHKLGLMRKVLYICPASLKFEVEKEIEKWLPKSEIVVIDGTPDERLKLWHKASRFHIANYEILLRDKLIMPTEWDLIILDEGHRIGNPRAQITKIVHGLKAPRRLVMTGTPIMSRPDQIWSLMHWIRPNCLGSYWGFRNTYCILNKFNGIAGYRGLDDLARRINGLYIRKSKRDVEKDLPPLTISEIPVELSANERRIYDIVKKELLFELKQQDLSVPLGSLGSAVVNMIRLRQIAGSLQLVSDTHKDSSKIDALKDKVSELMDSDEKEKIVIYTQFAKLADIISAELTEYQPLLIKGDVAAKDRSEMIDLYWNDPERRIMIITAAGGQGLNLQCASTLIMMDLSFSIGQNLQVIGRIERIGQQKPMFVYNLTARKTIDEHIAKTLVKRKEMAEQIFNEESEYGSLKVGEMINILESDEA